MGQAPHAIRRPPCRAAASRFHIPVFHATFVPHAIPRPPHTWATSPYGIAVSPYNHTPDAFPHTFSADPPYDPQALKIRLQIRRDQRVQFHKSQPTLSSKHTEPALQSSKPSAGQVQQMLQTCDWGAPSPPVRKAMVIYSWARVRPWSCAHGHSHARPWSYIHGHAHGHASDETSVRLAQIKRQSN